MRNGRGSSEGHLARVFDSHGFLARVPSTLIVVMLLCLTFIYAIDLGGQPQADVDDSQGAESLAAYMISSAASPRRVYVDEQVTFFVNASSTVVGAMLDITIYFDYRLTNGSVNPSSPYFHTQEAAPAYVTTTYAYDHIGNLTDTTGTTYFQVWIFVNDGTATQAEAGLKVYVVGNTAPTLTSKPASTIYDITYEVPYKLVSYVVQDYDNELVTATWDFGDGTELAVNETLATAAGSYISQNHTWVIVLSPGRDSLNPLDPYFVLFDMSVKFEDAYGHVVYSNHTVNITPPRNYEPARTFAAQSNDWSPGYELPFYASATDPEGDPITWTYVFSYSGVDYMTDVYHTDYTVPGTTMWRNVTHTFSSSGVYNVTLFISDAMEPWQVYNNLSQTIQITVKDNVAPGVLANITMSPVNPTINTTLGYAEVFFSIQANDFDSDVLYLTWDFGDGEGATNQSVGGSWEVYTFYQTHRYTVAGEYNITVLVDDNRGHTVLRYKAFNVLTTNAAPSLKNVLFELSHGVYAAPNTTVNITVILYDFEGDPLTVWIDFGDNSTVFMAVLTDFSENNTVTVLVSHVYNSTGKFNVTVTYTDGMFGPGHNASMQVPLEVKVPRDIVIRVWNWWDSVSLGLVFLGVALVFARWYFLGKFRKELDKKGLSLEEYKTMVAELKRDRDTSLRSVDAQVKANKMNSARAKQVKADIRDTYVKKVNALRSGTLAGVMGGGA